jgi:hypothetical protein
MKYESPITFNLCDMNNVKVFKKKAKVQGQGSEIEVPTDRSCHKEHSCEIWKPYYIPITTYGQF